MKAFIAKYWRRLRYTEEDARRRVRAEALVVAQQQRFECRSASDLVRAASVISDFVFDSTMPPDTGAPA